ncbi:TetR/AcrR family transcriptional regulator [Cohnella fermenti]|uniref:TetR/AcrR family transcriptional regulator n=1 Tax=Cohnella fermenti TaxID=2565925 RepID=A0A4V3WEI0_9BACL|nr:TetR/AcrR family transcriptional regulator [Cohnella fermenti]THF76388.1 TetR/AcrR family transcriptional regulator [Cohnella fermenti]
MPRIKRSEQAAATREKLLETAKSLFAEKGYHGTPVRAINRSIGMGDGILYHYFPGGKREMLSVLIRESFERRREALGHAHRAVERMELRDALLLFIRRLYDLLLADLAVAKILIREHEVLELEETLLLSEWFEEQFANFSAFLDKRRAGGELRADLDVTLAARQFLTMGMQAGVSKVTGIPMLDVPEPDRYFERTVDFTLNLWRNP